MRSAASPQKKTPPIVWVGILGAAAIAYMTLGSSEEPPVRAAARAKKKPTGKAAGLFTEADEKAKFPPLALATMPDVFMPGVRKPVLAVVQSAPPNPNRSNIPASITGGDGNWYFTGRPEVNGRPQALLENTTTGESVYVNAGEAWKLAKVATIDVSSVTLVGSDGTTVRVPLQEYGATPGAAPAPVAVAAAGGANGPLSVPSGLIGGAAPGGLGVRPTGGGAAMAMPATIDGGNNEGGRGRRRNRQNQNNPGDQNNVP